jgi:hypothetical protein
MSRNLSTRLRSEQLDLADTLKQHNINYVWYPTPGVRDWKVWRHGPLNLLKKFFQEAH